MHSTFLFFLFISSAVYLIELSNYPTNRSQSSCSYWWSNNLSRTYSGQISAFGEGLFRSVHKYIDIEFGNTCTYTVHSKEYWGKWCSIIIVNYWYAPPNTITPSPLSTRGLWCTLRTQAWPHRPLGVSLSITRLGRQFSYYLGVSKGYRHSSELRISHLNWLIRQRFFYNHKPRLEW